MTTIAIVAICVTAAFFIAAGWDAARRYIEMKRHNDALRAEWQRIEDEHDKLAQQVKALSEKLNLQGAANVSRLNRMRS